MAKIDRTGVRNNREQSRSRRVPRLGYYLIVTDTEGTEKCFFTGLNDTIPSEFRDKIIVKVEKAGTDKLIDKCLDLTAYDPQYRIPWIVFDRDQVQNFDTIIESAEKKNIHVGWSNPCFEIWMYAYYGSMPAIQDSWICCSKFGDLFKKKNGIDYDKNDAKLYQKLLRTGDEKKALDIAEQKHKQNVANGYKKPSQMCPCTTVYELVGEIREKVKSK